MPRGRGRRDRTPTQRRVGATSGAPPPPRRRTWPCSRCGRSRRPPAPGSPRRRAWPPRAFPLRRRAQRRSRRCDRPPLRAGAGGPDRGGSSPGQSGSGTRWCAAPSPGPARRRRGEPRRRWRKVRSWRGPRPGGAGVGSRSDRRAGPRPWPPRGSRDRPRPRRGGPLWRYREREGRSARLLVYPAVAFFRPAARKSRQRPRGSGLPTTSAARRTAPKGAFQKAASPGRCSLQGPT